MGRKTLNLFNGVCVLSSSELKRFFLMAFVHPFSSVLNNKDLPRGLILTTYCIYGYFELILEIKVSLQIKVTLQICILYL